MKDDNVGFRPFQVDSVGNQVLSTLANAMWFIDPHIPKLESRGISLGAFGKFQGFNDPKAQKHKIPLVGTKN